MTATGLARFVLKCDACPPHGHLGRPRSIVQGLSVAVQVMQSRLEAAGTGVGAAEASACNDRVKPSRRRQLHVKLTRRERAPGYRLFCGTLWLTSSPLFIIRERLLLGELVLLAALWTTSRPAGAAAAGAAWRRSVRRPNGARTLPACLRPTRAVLGCALQGPARSACRLFLRVPPPLAACRSSLDGRFRKAASRRERREVKRRES
jgi:hypothetical protein